MDGRGSGFRRIPKPRGSLFPGHGREITQEKIDFSKNEIVRITHFSFSITVTFLYARNDESAGQTGNPFQKDEVDKRIDKAIAFIISKQKKDGSIYDRGNHTTMTSLALMAMAAVGHQPVNPNDEGEAMQRALDFVLQEDRQSETGYYGSKDGSRMYGHGITTLTLSEMLGMGLDEEQDQKIRKELRRRSI